MRLTSFSKLGSPLSSPTLNGQFRGGMRSPSVRRIAPFLAGGVVFFYLIQIFSMFGGGDSRQYGQYLQTPLHSVVQSPSNNNPPIHYEADFPQTRSSDLAVRSDFPAKIWQTWKVDPLHFEERDLNTARSWPDRNPDWRYEVLTDGNDLRYVEYHYGVEGFNRPDVVAFYRDVKAAIIKADLLRYLIMYAEGGVYADIDVEAMRPMSKFIPERYDHKDIDMVVGIEIDEPQWKDHPILGPKSRSFCQWTFMCKPHLPVMMRLVENIMSWLIEVARTQNVSLGEVVLDFDEVISGTGPSAFTKAIIAQLNADRVAAAEDGQTPSEITWDTFHDLDESKLVDHVLVLNVEAFAAGQGHSDSGSHDTRHSLVRHHYHASNWPSRHPRFQHPAYGQVEDCNWAADCVHRWDEDVARFETLSPQEQQLLTDERNARLAQEAADEEARQREEADNRAREEEQRRREDAERVLREDEARRLEEERKKFEEMSTPRNTAGSVFSHGFGYIAFVGCVFAAIVLNNKRQEQRGPALPMSEPRKA